MGLIWVCFLIICYWVDSHSLGWAWFLMVFCRHNGLVMGLVCWYVIGRMQVTLVMGLVSDFILLSMCIHPGNGLGFCWFLMVSMGW